ncbi:MAG: sulfotransferase family protein [Verrucomicrobiales bacterium]
MLDSHRDLAAIERETGVFFVAPKRIAETLAGFDRFAAGRGARRWVEKTPDHLLHFETLRVHCPRHPVILMLRDDRDLVASLKARFEDFSQAVETWQRSARVAAELLERGRDPFLFPLCHERLVEAPERVLRRLCRHLGLSFDPAMLGFHRTPRHWYSSSTEKPAGVSQQYHPQNRNWQINQPLFDPRRRWQRDLTAEETSRLEQGETGKLLQRMERARHRILEREK